MAERKGGLKRSSWLIFRRRLLLVRLLLRNPMTGEEVIAAIQEELGVDGYPMAATAALKHDFDALKSEYDCRIIHQRDTGRYIIDNLGVLALLDLSDDTMEGLAFLDASFPPGSPLTEHTNVRRLLDRLVVLLPTPRQEEHRSRQAAARLMLPGNPSGRINSAVLLAVKQAIEARQELSFRYWSSTDVDTPRRHRVAPYGIFFRPEGHGYLDATLLDVESRSEETVNAAVDYRLDRIVPGTIQILPQLLPPQRPRPRTYALRYWLHPNIARRRDVASFFPATRITYAEDGSATVSATVTNLWQTRQILLRYGDTCRVIEPAELVSLMRETARGLARTYRVDQ